MEAQDELYSLYCLALMAGKAHHGAWSQGGEQQRRRKRRGTRETEDDGGIERWLEEGSGREQVG